MRRAGLALSCSGALGLALIVFWLRRRMAVVTVEGDSMWPAFMPGDRVVIRRTGAGQLRVGQVAVAEQPGADGRWPEISRGPVSRRKWMIKRIAALPGDLIPECCLSAAHPPGSRVPPGELVLLGDNAAWSQDSRQLGCVPVGHILGVVVRLSPRS